MGSHHRTENAGVQATIGRARDHLAKALDRLASGTDGDRDATVHEVRKRVKKARAMIRLARGSVGRKAIAKADRRLREAAYPLSAVRDAFVLVQTLDALTDRPEDRASVDKFAEARAMLAGRRDEVARQQLDEGGALDRAAKTLRSTRRTLAKWDVDGDEAGPIEALKRAYRRGRDASRVASDDPSAEPLHELRKRVKALGYQLGTVEGDPAAPVARLRRLAGLLAAELGEIHDLDVLHEVLADHDGTSPVLEPLARRRLTLRHSALQRARVVFFDKPRSFATQVEAAMEGAEVIHAED